MKESGLMSEASTDSEPIYTDSEPIYTDSDLIYIEESGMEWGPFPKVELYRVEKCQFYIDKLRNNGIKTCEFILFRKDKLYFIEVKKEVPREYEIYMENISQKFSDSAKTLAFSFLWKHNEKVGINLRQGISSKTEIHFILIIAPDNQDVPRRAVRKLTDKLKKSFTTGQYSKCLRWCGKKRCKIFVWNKEYATKEGFKHKKITMLNLPLKEQWFNMIESGAKTIDYRKANHHWETRIPKLKPGDDISLSLEDTAKRLYKKIERIEKLPDGVATDLAEPGLVYAIHLKNA